MTLEEAEKKIIDGINSRVKARLNFELESTAVSCLHCMHLKHKNNVVRCRNPYGYLKKRPHNSIGWILYGKDSNLKEKIPPLWGRAFSRCVSPDIYIPEMED